MPTPKLPGQPITRVPIETAFIGGDSKGVPSGISWPWLHWFQFLSQRIIVPPGPYANDAAAAAAGVALHSTYYQTTGAVVVRLT